MISGTLPWTEFYRPLKLSEVVGNDKALKMLTDWFNSWSPNAKQKAALLHGPAGTGKTTSTYALAKERGYELVEMNASDTRNKDSILRIAGNSAKEGTLIDGAKGKRILLIDEVDGITGNEDRGGVKSLVDVIAFANIPIICTANDAYDQKLSLLRKVAKVIPFQPIPKEFILKTLDKIVANQKLKIPSDYLIFISENAFGDLRSAINDLEALTHQIRNGKITNIELIRPYRDKSKGIQETLNDLFKAKNFIEGKKATDGLDLPYDELLLWVFENAYMHVSQNRLPDIYDSIADADRFLRRIMKTQDWKLLSYFFDLLTGGVATFIDNPSTEVKQYIYPQKISMFAQLKFDKALRDSITSSIAEKTHVSKYVARNSSLPYVKSILNGKIGDAADMAYWLELDDNQLQLLVENVETINKIKKVMKAIEIEKAKKQTSMEKLRFSSFDRKTDDWTEVLQNWEEAKAKKQLNEEPPKEKKQKEEKGKKEKPVKKEDKDQENKQISLDQFFK